MDRGLLLRKRIKYAFWLVFSCYLGLVGRLLYLQGVQGKAIRAEAISKRTKRFTLPAHRGTLYDRNNRQLAASVYTGSVGFDPIQALPDPKNPAATARKEKSLKAAIQQVAELLKISPVELEAKLRKEIREEMQREALPDFNPKKRKRFVLIQKDVPIEVAMQFQNPRAPIFGFGVDDGDKRLYATGDNAMQIVGLVDRDGKALSGLERSCAKWLDGEPGHAVAQTALFGREIPATRQNTRLVRDGLDVHTTLDSTIQHIARTEAQEILDKYRPKGVAVVIVEPQTGDILAMVSLPTFDPNPNKALVELQQGESRKLTADEKIQAQWERCASFVYEPGSTLKTMTIAAALDRGKINRYSGFYCGGSLQVGKKSIHDSHGEAHGMIAPNDILRHSCNIGAAQIGIRLGPEALYAAEHKFGLLEPLDMKLAGTQSGYLSAKAKSGIQENPYTNAKAARVAFGQAITTTPMHIALAYSAIANGGVLMKPRLITRITDSEGRTALDKDGKTRLEWKPQTRGNAVSAQTSAEVTAMLREVVSNGTGKVAAVPGYQVAGKTGTSRKYRPQKYVGSFAGFIPASPNVKPRAVILVSVDEPQGSIFGADVAAPTFQRIATKLMAYWHVPEDDPDATQAKAAQENLRHGKH